METVQTFLAAYERHLKVPVSGDWKQHLAEARKAALGVCPEAQDLLNAGAASMKSRKMDTWADIDGRVLLNGMAALSRRYGREHRKLHPLPKSTSDPVQGNQGLAKLYQNLADGWGFVPLDTQLNFLTGRSRSGLSNARIQLKSLGYEFERNRFGWVVTRKPEQIPAPIQENILGMEERIAKVVAQVLRQMED